MTQVGYTLSVNDSPIEAVVLARLKRMECEEHVRMADILRLTFNTSIKADGSGWDILDDQIFERLTKIKLTVTAGSRTRHPLFEGYVVEVKATLSSDPGQTSVNVVAFDPSVLMSLEEKIRAWPDMADSDIASTLFGEYGFSTQVDTTQPTRTEATMTVMQRGTDIQFLQMLARRNGYDCYVDLNPSSGTVVGHFHAPLYDETPQGVLSVGLGAESNVQSLTIEYNMLQPAQTAANGVDSDAVEAQPTEVTSMAATALGKQSTLSDERPRKVLVSGTGLSLAAELQTYAQAVTDRSALALRAEGEVKTQTYGSIIRAKYPILVRGVGKNWSGTYLVERVLHVFEGVDYTQSFTLRRNATQLTGQEDFTAESSS